MKRIKKQLAEIEGELIEGKKLVKEKDRAVARARTSVKKNNSLLAAQTARKGVLGLKQYRSVLEEIEVEKSTAGRGRQPKKKNKTRRARRGSGSAKRRVTRPSSKAKSGRKIRRTVTRRPASAARRG
jgi:hypothetical protein